MSTLRIGERIPDKGKNLTVTKLDVQSLPRIRDHLISVARRRGTSTYGELKADAGLPHPANGLGRLLDVVGMDCKRRGEPDLAALVVNARTHEVGSEYGAGAAQDREEVYQHWSR